MTLSFYDQNAESFFKDTIQIDMRELYSPFIKRVKTGGRILDAGCGSGRDTKAFLELGFQVDAIDASIEMVKLATQYTGLPVKQQTLESISEKEIYDGIWACASLLHVSKAELPKVFKQFEAALNPNGVWYMSFKYGNSEREKDGRIFTDLNEELHKELLSECKNLSLVKQWVTEDKRPGRNELWLNSVVSKKGPKTT